MSEDSEEIFKTLFERLYNLPPDRPDRQYRPRRKKNTGNKTRYYWEIQDMNINQMKINMNDKFFIGASDYGDWLFLQIVNSRTEKKLITLNFELKLHGSRHEWKEYIENKFKHQQIIQFNESSGIIICNEIDLIRYDVGSNSIHLHLYGDNDFIEKCRDDSLKNFKEVTSYIDWVYSGNGDSVNVPLNSERLPIDEMYPFLEEPLTEYYDRYMQSNANILLLIGPPGTGKTTFIRGLLSHTNSSAIVTYDATILEKDYVFAKFIEDETDVMVLEDSDTFLKARSDGNTMMHRFLNVGDGLVTTKGKKLIFSTNLPSISDIDPALIRPGRCFDILSFNLLKREEAQLLADKVGATLEGDKDSYSIAEVFNKKIESVKNRQIGTKMGFI